MSELPDPIKRRARDTPVGPKAKIHFTGWINRNDGTREMITGESEELDEQACIDAGIKKEEKSDGTDS